jgi:hypothetical protein
MKGSPEIVLFLLSEQGDTRHRLEEVVKIFLVGHEALL